MTTTTGDPRPDRPRPWQSGRAPDHDTVDQTADGTFRQHRFDVFISYSRRDAAFARRLQRALSGYTPPADLPVPQRRLRVFRDESDFQGTEYEAALEEVLKSAAKLLVICSPSSRASSYVGGEIERFAALRGKQHIVSVLLAGVPNNEGPVSDDAKAFHEALVARLPTPLAADFRGFDEKRDRIERDRYESAWYKLLADVYAGYGVDRGAVEQREKKRQRRTRRIRTAAVTALTIVLASLTIWALISRQEAIAQRNTAQSRFLASQSMSGAHPYDLSLLLAVAAHRTSPTFEAWEALFVGLRRQPALQRFLHGVDAPVRRISAGSSASCVAAWTESDTTTVWDLKTGQRRLEISGSGIPDTSCRSLVVVTNDGEVRSMALDGSEKPRWTAARSPGPVSAWALAPDDSALALAHAEGPLLVRDMADGRPLAELAALPRPLKYLRFSLDGRTLAGIDFGGMLHRWSASTLEVLSPAVRCGETGAEVFALSADLHGCAAGGPGRLDVTDLTAVDSDPVDLGAPWILTLDFSPDGRTLMAGVQGGDLIFWKIDEARRDGARARKTVWSGHRSDVTAAAYVLDGGAVVSAARDRSVIVWRPDAPSRLVAQVASVPEGSAVAADAAATRIAVGTPAGDLLRSSLGSSTATKSLVARLDKPIRAVALRRNGEIFAGTEEGEVVHWDGKTRRALSTGHSSPIVAIRLDHDETRLVAGAEDGRMTLWDLASGTPLASFSGERPRDGRGGGITPGVAAAFEPRGRRIVSVHGDQRAFVWDWRGATPRFSPLSFKPTSFFTSAAFGADGRTVALGTGIYEGEVVLIDIGDPDGPVTRLPAHDLQEVTGLAFSPDGRLLFSGGFDGGIAVWDVAGRRRIGDVHRAPGSVTSLRYASDGAAVIAATERGAVLRWDLAPENWLSLACAVANRDLSPEERARFVGGRSDPTACP